MSRLPGNWTWDWKQRESRLTSGFLALATGKMGVQVLQRGSVGEEQSKGRTNIQFETLNFETTLLLNFVMWLVETKFYFSFFT